MISQINLTPEYYANLYGLNSAFPDTKILTIKQVKEYTGIKDNRTIKKYFGVKNYITKETLAVKLSK